MIKFDLSNRVAVITGGAQGFGFAIAERFIQSGAKVIIWDIDEQEAKKAVEKMFDVKVDRVRIMNVNGKLKRFQRQFGKTKDWKKAYVRLKEGFDINYGEGEANS